MNTSKQSIFIHDDEQSISHKSNAHELANWITHLQFIHHEIEVLKKLCKKNEIAKEYYSLKLELNKKIAENQQLYKSLAQYRKGRQLINECEDIHCDWLFIQDHEAYRNHYNLFIIAYRNVKNKIFNLIT